MLRKTLKYPYFHNINIAFRLADSIQLFLMILSVSSKFQWQVSALPRLCLLTAGGRLFLAGWDSLSPGNQRGSPAGQ